jgi:hypothetical protein
MELLLAYISLRKKLKIYISFLEEGLEAALKATSALYDQTAESLTQLTAEDISNIFQGAKICDLLLQPGTTTLDLSLQAGCFTNESKYSTPLTVRKEFLFCASFCDAFSI